MKVTIEFDPTADVSELKKLLAVYAGELHYASESRPLTKQVAHVSPAKEKPLTVGLYGAYILPGAPNELEYVSLFRVASKNQFQRAYYRVSNGLEGKKPTVQLKKNPLPSTVYVSREGDKIRLFVKKEHVLLWN